MPSRREALALGAGAVSVFGAGCGSLLGRETEPLTLVLFNRLEREMVVKLELFDPESGSDAFNSRYVLPALGPDGPGRVDDPDVVEAKPYIARADIPDRMEEPHHHYYPDGGEEALVVNISPAPDSPGLGAEFPVVTFD